jgi:hypothetical protein
MQMKCLPTWWEAGINMFFEQSGLDNHNKLKYSLENRQHQKKIMSFLRSNLQEITNKLIKTAGVSLLDFEEDDITGEIHNLLNEKLRESSGYLFRFEAKCGPDILMFASPYEPFSEPLFVIEAKRLRSRSGDGYVCSGIERFKKEKHAKLHDNAAMLGYVQEKDFDHWHNKVNSWIDIKISKGGDDDITWTQADKINVVQVTDIGEYISTHSRIKKGPIMLHHFWLNFCNN